MTQHENVDALGAAPAAEPYHPKVFECDAAPMSKWTPTTDLMLLRRMGKTGEEAAELSAVTNRCIIQGIDEVDPGTEKVNRQRLTDEIADVQAQLVCTVLALKLDLEYIAERTAQKIAQMREWEAMFPPVDEP